ncbi:hypothetical protein FH972_002848 [Carpinus fangiana]|uniref:Serine-threonine/tyrosine-protein kinase catalytic domain-containing protein n=1 Tax=Carpinus fangiana TaxID=176857 RepID=A0A5N6QI16_9ROSI|nr:hypothetical protein FH972_002848 [Carpinus fangiana]
MVLTDWIYKCYFAGELKEAVSETELDMEELEKMVKVGLWCVHIEAVRRPSMKSVIMMLKGTVVTEAPHPPHSHVNV